MLYEFYLIIGNKNATIIITLNMFDNIGFTFEKKMLFYVIYI